MRCPSETGAFNCAAPFRERLDTEGDSPATGEDVKLALQLCRPLSGAVRSRRRASCTRPGGPFNCAAPFRERLVVWLVWFPARLLTFNCAAPFRERLETGLPELTPSAMHLQLCRPLSGAVSLRQNAALYRRRGAFNCAAPFRERLACSGLSCWSGCFALQLCRPLSGAVSSGSRPQWRKDKDPSIVPPPFGSG